MPTLNGISINEKQYRENLYTGFIGLHWSLNFIAESQNQTNEDNIIKLVFTHNATNYQIFSYQQPNKKARFIYKITGVEELSYEE